MALFVYNLLLLLLSPLIALLLLWRLQKGKEDKSRWGERWGKYGEEIARDTRKPRFWVHAVSVGEVMAAVPVLRELRKRYPDAFILLSTTTIGGREVAIEKIPPADSVVYFPLDVPFACDAALKAVRPDVILLMEWEIWPNFLTAAKRHGAKVAVLNGRISDKGLRRGLKAQFFTKPGLEAVDLFAMQSEEDSRRAGMVGVNPPKIRTLGNTKFDESATPLTPDERTVLRADLGIPEGVPVWICGSTRDDADPAYPIEETQLAEAANRLRTTHPNLFLIVAPRHLERADKAAAALEEKGWMVVRRSSGKVVRGPWSVVREEKSAMISSPTPNTQHSTSSSRTTDHGPRTTLLLDTFGELAKVYAVADVAFIGGSLVRRGGQSVFQPLAQGVPVVFGPYMSNQRDIAALSKAEGVGFEVTDAETLATEVGRLLGLSLEEKQQMAERARALIERNQGVSARCVDTVAELMARQ